MGFFSNIIGSVVKDVVNIATGEDVDATKDLLASAKEDAGEAINDLCDGEL